MYEVRKNIDKSYKKNMIGNNVRIIVVVLEVKDVIFGQQVVGGGVIEIFFFSN